MLFIIAQHVCLKGNSLYSQWGQTVSFESSLHKIAGFSNVRVGFNMLLLDNMPNWKSIFSSNCRPVAYILELQAYAFGGKQSGYSE